MQTRSVQTVWVIGYWHLLKSRYGKTADSFDLTDERSASKEVVRCKRCWMGSIYKITADLQTFCMCILALNVPLATCSCGDVVVDVMGPLGIFVWYVKLLLFHCDIPYKKSHGFRDRTNGSWIRRLFGWTISIETSETWNILHYNWIVLSILVHAHADLVNFLFKYIQVFQRKKKGFVSQLWKGKGKSLMTFIFKCHSRKKECLTFSVGVFAKRICRIYPPG